jgi:hypothetical protein
LVSRADHSVAAYSRSALLPKGAPAPATLVKARATPSSIGLDSLFLQLLVVKKVIEKISLVFLVEINYGIYNIFCINIKDKYALKSN